MRMTRLPIPLTAIFLFLVLALGACSDVSPAFNKFYRGRTLDLSVVTIERVSQLRYATIDQELVTRHYLVTPSEPDLELVLVRLKVQNHTATSASLIVDDQAAELRDFVRGRYYPITINDRAEEVDAPSNPNEERPNFVFVQGPFELVKGYGVDGWMVFEAPKDTKFRELRWRAGDSLTIEF